MFLALDCIKEDSRFPWSDSKRAAHTFLSAALPPGEGGAGPQTQRAGMGFSAFKGWVLECLALTFLHSTWAEGTRQNLSVMIMIEKEECFFLSRI